jgi:thiamine biosynthesis lipoprotein
MAVDRRTLLAGALAGLALPARADDKVRIGGPAFGSAWRATCRAANADTVRSTLARVVDATDRAASPWRADSDLAQLNRAGEGDVTVPPLLREVAAEALTVSETSGGAFDPTVGPLVRRFGWGPIVGGAPGREAFALGPGGIAKARADATLDLCGVAKGHALDRAVAALAAEGIADALVEMGGEVRALGRHPSGRPWRIGVEAPGGAGVQRVLAPGGWALATSGLAPNGYAAAGRRTAHIVDPRTSRPVPGDVRQVTVAARRAAHADAWATALLVLGAEAGPDLADRSGLAALFLRDDGGEVMTAGFSDLVVA